MKQVKNTWIIVQHPGALVNAIGLTWYIKERYGINHKVNLCISKIHHWDGISEVFLSKHFDQIVWFPETGFSNHFIKEIKKISQIKQQLQEMGIKAGDVFISLCNKCFLDNIIFSEYKNNFKIKFNFPHSCYSSLAEYFDRNNNYRETLTSKVWNLTIIPFFKLEPIVFLKNIKDKDLYDLVYKQGDAHNVNILFIFKNYETDCLGLNEIYNFSALVSKKLSQESNNSKREVIVFWGQGRNSYGQRHFEFTNKCLRYIEQFFPDYNYVFRSHPDDKDNYEIDNIKLGKFNLVDTTETAEIFILNNYNKIAHTFSICSTAVLRSLDLGIKSHYFFKLFGYAQELFGETMAWLRGINDAVFINDFNLPPKDYVICEDNYLKFNNNINKLDLVLDNILLDK